MYISSWTSSNTISYWCNISDIFLQYSKTTSKHQCNRANRTQCTRLIMNKQNMTKCGSMSRKQRLMWQARHLCDFLQNYHEWEMQPVWVCIFPDRQSKENVKTHSQKEVAKMREVIFLRISQLYLVECAVLVYNKCLTVWLLERCGKQKFNQCELVSSQRGNLREQMKTHRRKNVIFVRKVS